MRSIRMRREDNNKNVNNNGNNDNTPINKNNIPVNQRVLCLLLDEAGGIRAKVE